MNCASQLMARHLHKLHIHAPGAKPPPSTPAAAAAAAGGLMNVPEGLHGFGMGVGVLEPLAVLELAAPSVG
jgi:hypothetical protein